MKTFVGKVVSVGMQNTVVVKIDRKTPHSIYKKLIARSKKYKTDIAGNIVVVGDMVKIGETRPISRDKHFKIIEIVSEVRKEKKA